MDVRDYLRMLRRRWVWAVAGIVVAVSAAIAWVGYGPMTYTSAQTLILVGTGQGDSASAEARLNSYAALVRTPAVIDEVRRRLDRSEPAEDLSRRLTAEVKANTLILTVIAEDRTAEGARTLATSASQQLMALTSALSTPDEPAWRLLAADAAAPAVPATGRVQTIALGALLGLLLGVVLALVAEAADPRVRFADQLLRLGVAGVPVVEVRSVRRPLVVGDVPQGVRALRAMLFRGIGPGATTAVFSSCDERYPFPEVASSLGLCLARAGVDVVVVSADLRPGRYPGEDAAVTDVGLGEVLTGASPPQAVVRPGGHPNLWTVPQGRVMSYPEDVLASALMVEVLGFLHERHDVVLVHTPPLGVGSDALAVAEAGHAPVVLTLARGRTHRKQVRAALAAVTSAGLTPAAVVLVRPPSRHAAKHPESAQAAGQAIDAAAPGSSGAARPSSATGDPSPPGAPSSAVAPGPLRRRG